MTNRIRLLKRIWCQGDGRVFWKYGSGGFPINGHNMWAQLMTLVDLGYMEYDKENSNSQECLMVFAMTPRGRGLLETPGAGSLVSVAEIQHDLGSPEVAKIFLGRP